MGTEPSFLLLHALPLKTEVTHWNTNINKHENADVFSVSMQRELKFHSCCFALYHWGHRGRTLQNKQTRERRCYSSECTMQTETSFLSLMLCTTGNRGRTMKHKHKQIHAEWDLTPIALDSMLLASQWIKGTRVHVSVSYKQDPLTPSHPW